MLVIFLVFIFFQKSLSRYNSEFVIGYDDLLDDAYPGENKPFKNYGRNWNYNCKIKAADTLWVQPGAEGDREEIEIEVETEVNFELKLFYGENFSIEFDENSPIDISVDSLQEKNLKNKHLRFFLNKKCKKKFKALMIGPRCVCASKRRNCRKFGIYYSFEKLSNQRVPSY